MSFQKPYVKFDTDIFEQLSLAGVPEALHLPYFKLATRIKDGNIAHLKNSELQELFKGGYRKAMGIIKRLVEHGAVQIHSFDGMPNKYELLIGAYKGFREPAHPLHSAPIDAKGTLDVSSVKSKGSHVRALKSLPLENKTLVQQKGQGSSSLFRNISKAKIKLATRYVELMVENGLKLSKGFNAYLYGVIEKTVETDGWKRMEDNISELKESIEAKEKLARNVSVLEREKEIQRAKEKRQKEAEEMRRIAILDQINSFYKVDRDILRQRAISNVSETSPWMRDKLRGYNDNNPQRMIELMIESEMVELFSSAEPVC